MEEAVARLNEKILHHLEQAQSLASELGYGDIGSYARSREVAAAIVLGHKVASSFSGADAYNEAGMPVEYKSTISDQCRGAYTGISVQSTWKEQVRYLREEKIAKYSEHYYNRFSQGRLVESWKVDGKIVLNILLPKLKKKYPTVLKKKDPRLSASVTWGEIQKYGKRVL